jgi:hypothetical protein
MSITHGIVWVPPLLYGGNPLTRNGNKDNSEYSNMKIRHKEIPRKPRVAKECVLCGGGQGRKETTKSSSIC